MDTQILLLSAIEHNTEGHAENEPLQIFGLMATFIRKEDVPLCGPEEFRLIGVPATPNNTTWLKTASILHWDLLVKVSECPYLKTFFPHWDPMVRFMSASNYRVCVIPLYNIFCF